MKVLLTILALMVPTLVSAEVSYTEETNTLRITGPTTMPQVVEASNIIREKEVLYVEMWGPGGDLVMGLQLGSFLSKIEGLTVTIPKGKYCASACAYAAMGAGHIRVDGSLMLHRPYVTGVSPFHLMDEVFAHMGKGYLLLAYYLEDRGYNRSVMNSIMSYTSPCKFMVYDGIEIREPEDLKMWKLDSSRCEMMQRVVR